VSDKRFVFVGPFTIRIHGCYVHGPIGAELSRGCKVCNDPDCAYCRPCVVDLVGDAARAGCTVRRS